MPQGKGTDVKGAPCTEPSGACRSRGQPSYTGAAYGKTVLSDGWFSTVGVFDRRCHGVKRKTHPTHIG
jgi:hypothetical protein